MSRKLFAFKFIDAFNYVQHVTLKGHDMISPNETYFDTISLIKSIEIIKMKKKIINQSALGDALSMQQKKVSREKKNKHYV